MRAMKKIGYRVDGLANMASYGTKDFDSFHFFHDERQFKNCLYDIKDKYDTICYSNEPDQPVKWIKEVVGEDKKIIVDLHDLDSIRRGFIPIPEREMFNAADGFIYVSNPIQKIENELHRIQKPNTVLYPYCNEGIIEYDYASPRQGLVYEGGANPPDDTQLNAAFAYRSLYGIIKRIVEMGNETHMFCGNLSAYKTYQHIGAVIHPPTEYDTMMKELVKYKYGLLIFNNEDGKQQQVALTVSNKLFEYASAGLPNLACWCPEMEKIINKHKIGFTFNHIDEIGDCSSFENRYQEIYDNIQTKRKELVMENFIVRYENLIADVLGLERKTIPDHIQKLHDFEYGIE
jgi:hypothetical protein